MDVGVIISIDSGTLAGNLLDQHGNEFGFSYNDGQSFFMDGSIAMPRFTGRHEQPKQGILKIPEAGDLVLFRIQDANVGAWGYLDSFIACADHRRNSNSV